jgi:hypothetical protein
MELAIEKMIALCLFIVGLSHVVQPRAWAEFFVWLRAKGDAGVFAVAFLHLPFGLLIVAFHNAWTGVPLIVTLLGWAWTIKGFLYFVFPAVGRWGLARVSLEKAWEFMVPGALFVILSMILAWSIVNR